MADDKYKLACVEYAAAQFALKEIKTAIGNHLDACRNHAIRMWQAENPGRPIYEAPAQQWENSPHLHDAYAMERDPYNHGGHYYINHDDDVESYLAETCEHCLKAHLAIQARKEARKRFGLAKRRITVMGAAAK